MIGALARKFFGSANDRRIKGYQSRVDAINALEPEIAALTDEALKARTAEFRQQLADGKFKVAAKGIIENEGGTAITATGEIYNTTFLFRKEADGTPIEGLYATGTSTASVMGRFYPGAGSSVGPSFVFGYIAAKHAANASNSV